MRNVSVPIGIKIPGQPNIADTLWLDGFRPEEQGLLLSGHEQPEHHVWAKLGEIDFSEGSGPRKLQLDGNPDVAGDQTATSSRRSCSSSWRPTMSGSGFRNASRVCLKHEAELSRFISDLHTDPVTPTPVPGRLAEVASYSRAAAQVSSLADVERAPIERVESFRSGAASSSKSATVSANCRGLRSGFEAPASLFPFTAWNRCRSCLQFRHDDRALDLHHSLIDLSRRGGPSPPRSPRLLARAAAGLPLHSPCAGQPRGRKRFGGSSGPSSQEDLRPSPSPPVGRARRRP